MGEIYGARDTKLHRKVTINVMTDAFARHPERLAHFAREEQFLVALNDNFLLYLLLFPGSCNAFPVGHGARIFRGSRVGRCRS